VALLATPRASKTAVVGVHDGRLKVQVAAPPVDGEANKALVAWLARALGVPRAAVTLRAGQSSRQKLFEVTGVSVGEARSALLPR
jgi:uncharacterized protein (TIGR00251 family)